MTDAVILATDPPQTATELSLEPRPPLSSAVSRCTTAYRNACKTEMARGLKDWQAADFGKKAFRDNLPPLVGYENVRDFIACIAQAILLNVVDGEEASKLLYAAQIALSAVSKQPAAPKPPRPATKASREVPADTPSPGE